MNAEVITVLKNKPFLTAAFIFGGISFIIFAIASLSFLGDSTLVSGAIARLFHISSTSFTNTTLAEISAVCAIPAFRFAFKSYCDTDEESNG